MRLPPQDVPFQISIPKRASLSDLNLTKPKPLYMPEVESVGMNKPITVSALQNMASSSVLDIIGDKLDMNKEKTGDWGRLL